MCAIVLRRHCCVDAQLSTRRNVTSCKALSNFLPPKRLCNRAPQEMDESTVLWRKGVWKVVRKQLRDPGLLESVEAMVYGSRVLSCAAFAGYWELAFEWLTCVGESALVSVMKKHYFETVRGRLVAGWSGGITRIAAASYVGSQPQESWHYHRLRPGLSDLRLPADVVVQRLGELFQTRLEQAKISKDVLRDVPALHWTPTCIKGGQLILKHERLRVKWQDEAGNVFWCMRASFDAPEKVRTGLPTRKGSQSVAMSGCPSTDLNASQGPCVLGLKRKTLSGIVLAFILLAMT